MKKRRKGWICTFIGSVLLLAALTLLIFNHREEKRAEATVKQILPKVVSGIEDPEKVRHDAEMAGIEIDGYSYIGYISIPSLGLELPIMSEWNAERLAIAPCRYSGSVGMNNLVIAGHNYAGHFGKLSKLAAGASMFIVDMDGVITEYQVLVIEILAEDAVEAMTDSPYDLSLFTCDYSGRSRITVRCDKVE